jgi:hypothetical protein
MRNRFLALGSLVLVTLITASGCSSSSPGGDTDAGGKSPDAAVGQDVLTAPDGPAPTWTNFAEAFTKTYCVACHNATDPDPTADPQQNFNLYADVVAHDTEIRCGVSPVGVYQSACPTAAQLMAGAFPPPGQFPIGTGPRPTDGDRLRMIEWINNGAPEN